MTFATSGMSAGGFDGTRRFRRRPDPGWVAITAAGLLAVVFALTQPPVNDLWAAKSRAAAAIAGVGVHYWFSWFSGIVPGNYSALLPFAYRVVPPIVLGVGSVVIGVWLTRRLTRDARHPAAATWFAAIALTATLWSGRIPFVAGTTMMVAALLAVRAKRPVWASIAGLATVLITPTSGAFLALGLAGLFLHCRDYRRVAGWCIAITGTGLVVLGIYFGMPGPQGYGWQVGITMAGAAALLLAKPPPYIRTVVLASLVLSPVFAMIPNGMGSNFGRFVWVCLPAAVMATGRAPNWRAITASATALCIVVGYTVQDLVFAANPMAPPTVYEQLTTELRGLPGLSDHRLELVSDGTHTGAYQVLNVAQLAGGWETQAENRYNAVLESDTLSAATYRTWLDANAVGYVALPRYPRKPGPEYKLLAGATPDYLTTIWSNKYWTLFQVADPAPILARPARLIELTQSQMTAYVTQPGDYPLQVRWSRFLQVLEPGAKVESDKDGWSVLVVSRPGTYTIHGGP